MILDSQINQIGGRTKLYGTPTGAKNIKDTILLNNDHLPYFYSKEPIDPAKNRLVKECVERRLKFLSNGQSESLYQIFTNYSGSVTKLSTDADYENHVPYTNRFVIDEGIEQDEEMPTLLTFDIECLSDDDFSFPISSKHPIISIAAKYKDQEWVYLGEIEEDVLLEFTDFISNCNPDIINGYNSNNFDIKYCMTRNEKHDLVDIFARFGNTYPHERVDTKTGKKYVKWFFPGRVNLDVILAVFADQSLNAKTKGRGLKAIGKYFHEKGDIDYKPIELEESIYSLWHQGEEGRKKLKEYNLRDVQCTHDICEKIYLPCMIELAKLLECDLQAACNYTQYWLSEIVLGKKYKEENVLCDLTNEDRHAEVFDKISNGTGKIQGALSGIRKRGFFWNPYKIDFKGYYPAIDREYNISPENCESVKFMTYNVDGYKQWETDTHRFFCIPDANCNCNFVIRVDKLKRGYLPQILDEFAELRDKIKEEKGKGSESRDWGIKIIMNALIGINALPYTTRGSILCSILVLGIARQYTKRAMEISEELGANICNYDTDGLLLSDYYHVDKIIDAIEKDSGLPIEHEASYDYCLIYKPKCYILSYKGELIVHGIALTGKDKPNLVDKLTEQLVHLLVDHYDDKNIVDHIIQFLLDIDFLDDTRFVPGDYMINKTLQRDIAQYIANTPQKRVAEEMVRRGSDVNAGDELTYFWGLFADENKNYIESETKFDDTTETAEYLKNRMGEEAFGEFKDAVTEIVGKHKEPKIKPPLKPKRRKIDSLPMLAEDWKLVSVEMTDINSQIDTLMKNKRMKGRWMSFYRQISQYLHQKDYAELAQEIGDEEWSATYYYYDKMYSKMNMIKSYKLRKKSKPTADFFTEFFTYLETYYPSEEEFSSFFEELCGISSIDMENAEFVDSSLESMEMAKQDIIQNLDEKYDLDWYSDRYNVDALTIAVDKYAKLSADVLSRVLSAFFGLVEDGNKDIKLNEMGRRIKDLFMRKEKIRGTSLPIHEFVKRKLTLWKDHHGIEPEMRVSAQTTLDENDK